MVRNKSRMRGRGGGGGSALAPCEKLVSRLQAAALLLLRLLPYRVRLLQLYPLLFILGWIIIELERSLYQRLLDTLILTGISLTKGSQSLTLESSYSPWLRPFCRPISLCEILLVLGGYALRRDG